MSTKLLIKKILGLSPDIGVQMHLETETHGHGYGEWVIKKDSLNKDSSVLSIGIGNDISFDLSVITTYGSTVIGIDPTPQVHTWINTQSLTKQFVFDPVGLSDKDGEEKFFKPDNPNYISHSINPNHRKGQNFIMVPLLSLKSLMIKYGLKHIDLLKMDIEGFEYKVITSLVNEDIPVKQLLVEFHHGMYGFTAKETEKSVTLLNKSGYRIFAISDSRREFSFLKT